MSEPRDDRTAVICGKCRATIPAWALERNNGLCTVCGFKLAEDVATRRLRQQAPPPDRDDPSTDQPTTAPGTSP